MSLLKLLITCLVLAPSIALARMPVQHGLQLSITHQPGVHAGSLELAFENHGDEVELPIRIIADTIQYDWLTVELTRDGGTQTLQFVADREKSAMQTVRIGHGERFVETIELEDATRDLAPGAYQVVVRWRAPSQLLTARTTLDVPWRCGLVATYAPPPPEPPLAPAPWSAVACGLAGLAFLVGRRIHRGVIETRVPHSHP